MKRKVFCTKDVCALDRLPDQMIGGGLRVQAAQYLVPLLEVENEHSEPEDFKEPVRKKAKITKSQSITTNFASRKPALKK
jgi:hypothetical protein